MKLPRFKLRTLLIAITTFALLLGAVGWWYRMQVAERRRELAIVQRIQHNVRRIECETQILPILKWSENFPVSDAFLRINGLTISPEVEDIDPQGLSDDVVCQLRSLTSLKHLLIFLDTKDWNLTGQNDSLIKSYIEQTKSKLPHLEITHLEIRG